MLERGTDRERNAVQFLAKDRDRNAVPILTKDRDRIAVHKILERGHDCLYCPIGQIIDGFRG